MFQVSGSLALAPGAAVAEPAALPCNERRPHEGPSGMKPGREAVDAFAREIVGLIAHLQSVLESAPSSWPASRGRLAASISSDLARAVVALDVAVEELYFQSESLQSSHAALEIERRAYQELFDGGPDGYLVTDPQGVILRANQRAIAFFACPLDDLVGEMLPNLVRPEDRASLQAAMAARSFSDSEEEWIGDALPVVGLPFRLALTSAVVRHSDGSVYRIRWSLRNISRRTPAR